MKTRDDLTRALIANALDMPAILDIPEISAIQNEDIAPALQSVWVKMCALHIEHNLSVTALVGALPPSEQFNLVYFNRMRDQYRGISLDDLANIAGTLRNLSGKAELCSVADWLAKDARNGRKASEIARDLIERVTPIALEGNHDIQPIDETLDEIEAEIRSRAANPSGVWGIPYAWERLTEVTGGKHAGELTILAGEPGVGKSFWSAQDALETAVRGVPVAMWSGEMRRKQTVRRLLQFMGLDGRRSKTGYMNDGDWEALRIGSAAIRGIPLYIEDKPLTLSDLRPMLTKLKTEKGIQQFVLDYIFLVGSPGRDEIERTNAVSRELKNLANSLELSIIAIASVTKSGMDERNPGKAVLRGSGQQIHDADNLYFLTKFSEGDNASLIMDMHIKPTEYDRYSSLHVMKARELDQTIKGGFINYMRDQSPKFTELKGE